MALELKPGRYLIGLWYIELPKKLAGEHGGNVMSGVWTDDFKEWHIQHRFRYYCGEDMTLSTFVKSNDKFKWYEVVARDSTEEAMEKKINEIMRIHCNLAVMMAQAPLTVEFFEVRGDILKMVKLAEEGKAPHWFNVISMTTKK